jgi:hypothetical protein
MVTAITVLSLLLACMAVVFAFAVRIVRKMSDEIKYQEDIIEAKNDALKYYVDAYQEQLEKILDLRHELNMIREANADSLRYAPKKRGRPKGSKNKVTKAVYKYAAVPDKVKTVKNKVTKPKFDKVKFEEKYGK